MTQAGATIWLVATQSPSAGVPHVLMTYPLSCRSCTGGKTEDFMAAAQLLHRAGGQVKVPTFLVPATQKVDPRFTL